MGAYDQCEVETILDFYFEQVSIMYYAVITINSRCLTHLHDRAVCDLHASLRGTLLK